MAQIVELLGEKIIEKGGKEVDVASLSGEGKVVGLYFSAHWCPPCRMFTPQLAKWYEELSHVKDKKFDIVFVSSDRDEKSFDDYFKEMPWKALPFSQREKKATLAKKFKISGIPTLILVDGASGAVLRTDGRAVVTDDPKGAEFPWKPQTLDELLGGAEFISNEGEKKTINDIKGKEKVLGIYFSAHWCGPCRSFTPQLVKTYKKLKDAEKPFDIVFASSDKDEASFKEYFKEMPWLALPHDSPLKKKLSGRFDVSGIPTFVLLEWNEEGKLAVITTNGRGAVSGDPDGNEFPWHPKPVNELTGSVASELNDNPSLVWFTDKDGKDEAAKVLDEIAVDYKARNKGKEDPLLFFYSSEGNSDDDDIGSSLRNFAKLPKTNPLVVILNIPDQQVYSSTEVTADNVKQLVKDYEAKKVEFKPLKS